MKAAKYSYDQSNFLSWAASIYGPPLRVGWPSPSTAGYARKRGKDLGVEAEVVEILNQYLAMRNL